MDGFWNFVYMTTGLLTIILANLEVPKEIGDYVIILPSFIYIF